jgi:hypothetical protein
VKSKGKNGQTKERDGIVFPPWEKFRPHHAKESEGREGETS